MVRRARASASRPDAAPRPVRISQTVDPEAWSLARLYANGDVRRLVVVDARTVLVRNSPE